MTYLVPDWFSVEIAAPFRISHTSCTTRQFFYSIAYAPSSGSYAVREYRTFRIVKLFLTIWNVKYHLLLQSSDGSSDDTPRTFFTPTKISLLFTKKQTMVRRFFIFQCARIRKTCTPWPGGWGRMTRTWRGMPKRRYSFRGSSCSAPVKTPSFS